MNTKSHIGFWLSLFVVLFLSTPVMRDGKSMEAFAASELQLSRETFGDDVGNWLERRANVVYTLYTPAATIDRAAVDDKGMQLTRQVMAGPGVGLAKAANSYIKGLVLNCFVVALRLHIFMLWFLLLLPVFIAGAVDGFVKREIKRAEFGAIRPAAYALTSMIVIPLAMAPVIYLVVPAPVSPLISPMWALLMVLPLAGMISNMQPIFGK